MWVTGTALLNDEVYDNGGGHACAAGLNHPEGVAQFYPRLLAALARAPNGAVVLIGPDIAVPNGGKLF